MKGNWTEEEKNILKECYNNGCTHEELALLLPNRNAEGIRRMHRVLKLKRNNSNGWSENELSILRDNYTYMSLEDLHSLLPNRTWMAITKMASILGLLRCVENTQRISSARVLLDETPISYYWIGFLLADGHFTNNNRLKLSLANLDINHLERFAKFIGCDVRPSKTYSTVSLMDTKNISLIKEKFDIVNRKTYIPCNISKISDYDLLLSLIVGFIDGDGSITYNTNRADVSLRILCHISWFDNLQYMLNSIYRDIDEIPPSMKIDSRGCACFTIGNNTVLRILKERMLKLNLPYMERKWDKIDISMLSRLQKSKHFKENFINIINNNPKIKTSELTKLLNVSESYIYRLKKNLIY